MKRNYMEEIIEAAGGQESDIRGIVIGDNPFSLEETSREIAENFLNRLLEWDEAKALLDYEYDGGYGCEDCHPITAWTHARVIFSCCYDGSTWVAWLPIHPMPNMHPAFFGGG